MQQQGTKILGDINTVLRSVLNIIYDLKEFRTRLGTYDNLKSDDKNMQDGARLSLKQIWLDKVDMAKGNSGLKAMALGQAGFTTLLDAFLYAKNEKDVEGIDLNERVKRILKPRIQEFNLWVKQSENELRKRYQLEKTYLKSQANSLKLYSRWAKPYLRSALQLESRYDNKNPALVKTFNTILLELTLTGKQKVSPPAELAGTKLKRKYYKFITIDFTFRGIPQKVQQQSHYAFGGLAEITFRGYALNEDEIAKVEHEIDKSDLEDTLKLIDGTTDESVAQLEVEINEFLDEKEDDKKSNKKKKSETNPILALFGYYNEKPNKKEKSDSKDIKKTPKEIKPESWVEKTYMRPLTKKEAKDTAFDLFDIYKKAHGMPSYT